MPKQLLEETKKKMDGALDALKKEFSGLRTGRASTSLLDPVQVDAYGSMMPIQQVATINAPEARLLTVQVWDKGMVKSVEKSIRDAGLGLNPMAEGTLIRIPLPELNADRRQELVKVAKKYAEEGRVAVRNVRRHALDQLKKFEKDQSLSQDDVRTWTDKIQQATDDAISKIDHALVHKEKEITSL